MRIAGLLIAGFTMFTYDGALLAAAWGDRAIPVAAMVRGDAVHTRDADELRAVVMGRLTDRFAAEQGIEVSDAELNAYIRHVDATLRARGITPVDTETAADRAARKEIATLFVRQWKVNRALFERFGGRVGFQQGGPEPLDALRMLAEAAKARGDLEFRNPELEAAFWRYYRTDAIHSFYPPAEAARVLSRPPWASTDQRAAPAFDLDPAALHTACIQPVPKKETRHGRISRKLCGSNRPGGGTERVLHRLGAVRSNGPRPRQVPVHVKIVVA